MLSLDREYVSLSDVRAMLNVSRNTLRRRVRLAGIQLYTDPSNERARMMRREDAERLLKPVPVVRVPE